MWNCIYSYKLLALFFNVLLLHAHGQTGDAFCYTGNGCTKKHNIVALTALVFQIYYAKECYQETEDGCAENGQLPFVF